jgi:Na+-transporting NADH:ubiquinone oxidoreductase subunit NqrB
MTCFGTIGEWRLTAAARWATRDPRHLQIAALAGLLLFGVIGLDVGVGPGRVILLLAVCLGAQYAFGKAAGLRRFDPRSALISGLSLCLLLRTSSPALAASAAVLAVGSKFVLRVRGKHVFNPTNFGLAATALLSGGGAWVSPGQWGSSAFFGFFLACAGALVVHRALRSDVTLSFLAAWAALLGSRALRLGDPLAIPLHQLESGSLLLFAFFMISDPRTTPDSRTGRITFGVLVALGAYFWQFALFRPSGPVWSLAALSPLVPLLDRLWPGGRYEWPHGGTDAPNAAAPRARLALVDRARPAVLRVLRREG